jgi:hypothetical protein
MENQTKKCKHCQSDIPKQAKVCPNCRRKQGGALKWVIIAFLGIGFIGAMGSSDEETKTTEQVASNTNPVKVEEVKQEQPKANEANVQTEASEIAESETVVVPQETEEEYKASCQEYKYKDVLRNPSDYVGQRIKITVKISTVHEASWANTEKYYFAYSNDEHGWWSGDRYGVFDKRDDKELKLLEDDIITVYGEISDPEYTSSLIVSSSEVFCIDMKYLDFISE